MKKCNFNLINEAFYRIEIRIKNTDFSYLLFPLISFALVLIFTAYISNGLNHRAGNPSHPTDYKTPPLEDLPLWFSVTPIGDEIIVTTSNGIVFKWPQQVTDLQSLKGFIEEIRKMSFNEIATASLINRSYTNHATVVISADRNLTYAHLKPIIFALAEAGISHYALETKLTEVGAL